MRELLLRVERIIKKALIKTSGHKGKAAEFLGWSRAKFWRKTREYGITKICQKSAITH